METETQINGGEIIVRLARLQTDVDYIKEHIDDITLDRDDVISIKEAKSDLKERKTRRL